MDEQTESLIEDIVEGIAEVARASQPHQPVVTEPLMVRIERNRKAGRRAKLAVVIVLAALVLIILVVGVISVATSLPRATATGVSWNPNVDICGFVPVIGFLGAIVVGVSALYFRKPNFAQTARLFSANLARDGQYVSARRALDDMALRVGVAKTVPLFVIPSDHVNAYVVGKSVDMCAMGITRGMADTLTLDELRAVFAHLFARAVMGSAVRGQDYLPLPVQADAEAMLLAGHPQAMLSALERVHAHETTLLTTGGGVMDAHFFAPWMAVPEAFQPLARLNEVSVDERVARLRAVLGAEGAAS